MSLFSQLFPSRPSFAPSTLGSQVGREVIVTGGSGGIGLELSSMLYHLGAKVHIIGRNGENCRSAIDQIKAETPGYHISGGSLAFVEADMADMASVTKLIETLTSWVTGIDLLFNNAGVVQPPLALKSPQGVDLSLATNVLGPSLLARGLLPLLRQSSSPRIIWTSSVGVELAPKGGLSVNTFEADLKSPSAAYNLTKLANWYLSEAVSKQPQCQNIVSVAANPGTCATGSSRHMPYLMRRIVKLMSYDAKNGALTLLWAALAKDVGNTPQGRYVVPFGRLHPHPRQDIIEDMQQGNAEKLWLWCENRVNRLLHET